MASAASPMRVFISYSRVDTTFVDGLETDLISRGFAPWVDRRRIEGGVDWETSIQRAIEGCAKLVVALTPAAAASEWVQIEYRHARKVGKPIIPVLVQPVSDADVPMYLDQLQWITSFPQDYEQGMRDLVIALSRSDEPTTRVTVANGQETSSRSSGREAGQSGQEIEPMSARDLYLEGRSAYEAGDQERAASFFEQLAAQHPDYLATEVKARLDEIIPQLRPARVQRLREQADRAHQQGAWEGEVRAWQGIIALDPTDAQAKEELPIAQHNGSREIVERYEVAREFYEKRGNVAAARRDLEALWKLAPYYGDPAGLAPQLGLKVPPSHKEQKRIDEDERIRKAAVERTRLEEENRAKAVRLAEEKRAADDARLAQERDEANERIREERIWIVKARQAARPRYRNRTLSAVAFSIWLCAVTFLAGIGVLAEQTLRISLLPDGALPSQLQPLANQVLPLAALVAAGILTYALGYWRALRWDGFGLAVLVAGALAAGTTYLLKFAPDPLTAYSLPFMGRQPAGSEHWLGVALAFCIVWAVVATVVGAVIGVFAGGGAGFLGGLGVGLLLGGLWGLLTGGLIGYFGVLQTGLILGLVTGIIVGLVCPIVPDDAGLWLGIVSLYAAGICLVSWPLWSLALGINALYILEGSLAALGGILAGTGFGMTLHVWFRRRESHQQIVDALKEAEAKQSKASK